MSKLKYVTGNIHKIGDLPQEAPSPSADVRGADTASGAVPAVSSLPASGRERLSAVTQEALQRRHEEFLRFRKDLLFRMEELSCELKNAEENGEKLLADSRKLAGELQICRSKLEECTEPDNSDSRYQVILAEKCRSLDLLRLSIIQISTRMEKELSRASGSGNMPEKETNLFAQMNSLSRKQLLRLGFWIFFPAMSVLFLSALIVGLLVLATFRLGL